MNIRTASGILLKTSVSIYASIYLAGCISSAVYKRLAITPDKVKNEFQYENCGYMKAGILTGKYLGKVNRGGDEYYHFQYHGMLRGEDRIVHLFLLNSCNSTTGTGCLEEGAWIKSDNASDSYFFYNSHPAYKEKWHLSEVGKNIENSSEYANDYGGWIWNNENRLVVFQLASPTKEWNCEINVNHQIRSKTLTYVRPLYAAPIAVVCIPIDIVMSVYTVGEVMIFPNSRIETLGYVNLVNSISENN